MCNSCTSYNGSYTVSWLSEAEKELYCASALDCAWGVEFGPVCNRSRARLAIDRNGLTVDVIFTLLPDPCDHPSFASVGWLRNIPTPTAACSLFSGLSLTNTSDPADCNFGGATVTVTALP